MAWIKPAKMLMVNSRMYRTWKISRMSRVPTLRLRQALRNQFTTKINRQNDKCPTLLVIHNQSDYRESKGKKEMLS
ncbi:hypothetical protein DdX_09474 [Ditylenchus destructor]|uniref:Uncharacterized protein n=1 Tax=Ditylenchus destructor TaxID=166010 RepID=A0AAD4R068_9BILA|nr:hypothetical protein DdX_09474 [Ditylenchus destructor]